MAIADPPVLVRGDASAEQSAVLGAALFGAAVASLASGAAGMVGYVFSLEWLAPAAALGLAAWGAAYGASAARASVAARPASYLRWGIGLIAATGVLSMFATVTLLVIEDSQGRGQWWPIDRIFEGIFGCGSTVVLMGVAFVVALVSIPLIAWLAGRLVVIARRDEGAAVRWAVIAVCIAAALEVAIDWTNTGLVVAALTALAAGVLSMKGRSRWILAAPLIVLILDASAHAARWSWESSVQRAEEARYTAPCCYTSQINICSTCPQPDARGAYAIAAEAVPGVAHARALYRDGRHHPQNGRPLAEVAIELEPGADERATLSRVRAALRRTACRICTERGGEPEMSARVIVGHAVELDVIVTADPNADAAALEAAIRSTIGYRFDDPSERFRIDREDWVGFVPPTAEDLGVPGALAWEIGGAPQNEVGNIVLPIEPGDHAVLGRVEVRAQAGAE